MSEVVIKPHSKLALNLGELKTYRELLFYFAWRDIKVRYKQTAVGAAWAILQPFASTVVFTLFFNKVAGIKPDGNIPYPVFAFLGLMFWNLFSASLTKSSNSIVDNQGVITKIYFPRLIPPLSSGVIAFMDFCVSTLFFIGLLFLYKITPGVNGILLLLPMVVVTLLSSLGAGMFFSAVNVKYRDVRQALPFLIQTLMFLTPVIYPVSLVPARFQWILYLNPMCGVISLLRNTILGLGRVEPFYLFLSFTSAIVMFVFGLYYFRYKEKGFADII